MIRYLLAQIVHREMLIRKIDTAVSSDKLDDGKLAEVKEILADNSFKIDKNQLRNMERIIQYSDGLELNGSSQCQETSLNLSDLAPSVEGSP